PSLGPPDRPARSPDEAREHHKRIGIEITRLKPVRDPVAKTDSISRAMRTEAIDDALVTAVPEPAADPERWTHEDNFEEFVKIPFVRNELVDAREGRDEAVRGTWVANVVVP